MVHNSRKSDWASGRPIVAVRSPGATGFEEEVRRLGLNEQTCEASPQLKEWCEHNKNRCYIPEWLLKRWEMSVDPDLSG
jgi:hypothetical protein